MLELYKLSENGTPAPRAQANLNRQKGTTHSTGGVSGRAVCSHLPSMNKNHLQIIEPKEMPDPQKVKSKWRVVSEKRRICF